MLRESFQTGLAYYQVEYLLFGLIVATATTIWALHHPDDVVIEVEGADPRALLVFFWALAFLLWPFIVALMMYDRHNDDGPWKG